MCAQVKPLDDFLPQKQGFLGRTASCRTCTRAYQSDWAKTDEQRAKGAARARRRQPEVRAAYVRRAYGERGPELEARRLAGDPCDACGRPAPVIDHDHATGEGRRSALP